jgi:folate-binding protein YgfZ
VPPGRAPALAEALERFHFAEALRLEDTSAGHAPLDLVGPEAGDVVERVLGARVALAPHASEVRAWRGAAVAVRALPQGAWQLDAGPGHVAELWDALAGAGATPCGLVVRDSLRVEDGRALAGVDVDENVYPQEAGLDDAFALDKGCYVGQEVVAKIDTYGGLNKRLLVLRVEHSDPVPRGTPLLLTEDGERRELGLVTTWAYSFRLDTGAVLAYVKRRHQDPGTRFDLGETHGAAVIVAPPGA